jgi:hypothetical protein
MERPETITDPAAAKKAPREKPAVPQTDIRE